ncbi:unnamed protein product [Trichobilharzia szidati]|nr:unnamed protein product [Trichobilharzia szidati]
MPEYAALLQRSKKLFSASSCKVSTSVTGKTSSCILRHPWKKRKTGQVYWKACKRKTFLRLSLDSLRLPRALLLSRRQHLTNLCDHPANVRFALCFRSLLDNWPYNTHHVAIGPTVLMLVCGDHPNKTNLMQCNGVISRKCNISPKCFLCFTGDWVEKCLQTIQSTFYMSRLSLRSEVVSETKSVGFSVEVIPNV